MAKQNIECKAGDVVRILTNQPTRHLMEMFPYGFKPEDFENVEPSEVIASVREVFDLGVFRMVSCDSLMPTHGFWIIEPIDKVLGIVSEDELKQLQEEHNRKLNLNNK